MQCWNEPIMRWDVEDIKIKKKSQLTLAQLCATVPSYKFLCLNVQLLLPMNALAKGGVLIKCTGKLPECAGLSIGFHNQKNIDSQQYGEVRRGVFQRVHIEGWSIALSSLRNASLLRYNIRLRTQHRGMMVFGLLGKTIILRMWGLRGILTPPPCFSQSFASSSTMDAVGVVVSNAPADSVLIKFLTRSSTNSTYPYPA